MSFGRGRRLLLTSAGLRNDVLESALAGLVGKPWRRAAVAVIPTASVAAPGHHGWLMENLNRLYGLGWREFSVVELNGLPKQMVLERRRRADVIYVEGGNPYYLANSIIENGLAAEMAGIIESKVYVGVSAGSMIFSRNLSVQTGQAFAAAWTGGRGRQRGGLGRGAVVPGRDGRGARADGELAALRHLAYYELGQPGFD